MPKSKKSKNKRTGDKGANKPAFSQLQQGPKGKLPTINNKNAGMMINKRGRG